MGNSPHPALPLFNTARGDAITTQPGPFDFEGVTIRAFPLRADQGRLEQLCEDYVDVSPNIAEFTVAAPYVFLLAINYGKMSSEASDIGWWSQNEVLFAVPLEWYGRDGGKMEFEDWAVLTPYIFVDDATSIATGREVYGWPKLRGWLQPSVDSWMTNPRKPRKLMDLRTHIFSRLLDGRWPEIRTLVEIEHTPPLSLAHLPLDREAVPFLAISRALLGSVASVGTFAQLAGSLVGGDSAFVDEEKLLLLMSRITHNMIAPRNLFVNTINVKQFRDVHAPHKACYQALTNARMYVTEYNAGGFLGDMDVLRGDVAGGYTVKIHDFPDFPIVDTLGLHVSRREEKDGVMVDVLNPRLPFWLDLDIQYELAERLCWRAKAGAWSPGFATDEPSEPPADLDPVRSDSDHDLPPYDTARGSVIQTNAGPFDFPEATLRVFPLAADENVLADFCDEYLNFIPAEAAHFKPLGNAVFLVAANYGRVPAGASQIGLWSGNEISFNIPIAWYRDGELVSYALFTPYIFADFATAVATGREVYGWPMTYGVLGSHIDAWMNDDGPAKGRRVLTLKTSVFKEVNAGRHPDPKVLLEIEQMAPVDADENEPVDFATDQRAHRILQSSIMPVAKKFKAEVGTILTEEFGKNPAAREAFEALSPDQWWKSRLQMGKPVNFICLKQFRDAAVPECACYQALVHAQMTVEATQVHTLEPKVVGKKKDQTAPTAFDVRIHDYPNQPIVKKLGLAHTMEDGVATLVTQQPFWLKAKLRYELGKRICSRTGTTRWAIAKEMTPLFKDRTDLTDLFQEIAGGVSTEKY